MEALSAEDSKQLHKQISKKGSKLFVLPVLVDRIKIPDYLNDLRAKCKNRSAGLRVVWKQDIVHSLAGTVAAIQETPEYASARQLTLLLPENWQRTEISGFVEALQFAHTGSGEFKPSRFSIRKKLLLITGLIVSLALASMIAMASYLFREHSETLIQGYNLSLARLVAESLEKDLQGIQYRGKALSDQIANQPGNDQSDDGSRGYPAARAFFEENPRYLYFAEVQSTDSKLELQQELFNGPFFKQYSLKPQEFRDLLSQWSPDSLAQDAPLQIRGFKIADIPLLGLSFSGSKQRIVIYVASDDFFQSFRRARQAGLFEIHLLSPQGKVLISSDEDSTGSVKKGEILEQILKSPVNNGSRKYRSDGKEYLASYQTLEGTGLIVLSHAEADQVFEAVRRIERQNLYLMGAVLAAAFLLVFLFARTLSVPIVRLARATGAVGRGDYSVRIQPTTRDEIGQLTHSFSRMIHGLQEREHIKDAFGKFVSPGIAERALRGEIKLGGEKKTGTVFFSDLRNFTELSENRQPEEVVDFLNRYFTAMVDCIQSTGGMVDKFIGDAIMAHWGTLVPSETGTSDAIRAALLMRGALIDLNRELEAEGSLQLRFGCGINTGPVIAGQIGSEKRLEYTVIGDTVNLASRIEYLNKLFGTDILISSYTMEQVDGIFDAIKMPALHIKGKSKPETVYAILGLVDDPHRPRSLEELRKRIGLDFDEQKAQEELKKSSDQMAGNQEEK